MCLNNADSSVPPLPINYPVPISFYYCDCSNTAAAFNFSAVVYTI